MTLSIKTTAIVLTVLTVVITAALIIGTNRKASEKEALLEKLHNTPAAEKPAVVDFASLKTLPEPVERYFRYVLTDGAHFIRTTRLEQTGRLKLNPASEKWSPFQATQIISQDSVSFIWDAKINIVPAFHVRVMDSLLEGVGAGNVSLMSAITIASDRNIPELNSGALYRYLAEAVWHPTALLPQSGVNWQAVDANRAVAHFTKFGMSITLEFSFNHLGEITGIYTEDRFGRFGNDYIKYPWEGHFSHYRKFDGVRIPTRGEVGWHLADGWWLFWQGEIVNAEFAFSN